MGPSVKVAILLQPPVVLSSPHVCGDPSPAGQRGLGVRVPELGIYLIIVVVIGRLPRAVFSAWTYTSRHEHMAVL